MASLDDVDADLLETEEAIQRIEDVHNRKSQQRGVFWSVFFFLCGETKILKSHGVLGFWSLYRFVFFLSFESNAFVESSEFW